MTNRCLPGWLVFDGASRTLHGVAGGVDIGSLDIKITATDLDGHSASDVFKLTINGSNHPPVGSIELTGSAVQGNTLKAINSFADADGMAGASVTYQWMRDGVMIQGVQGDGYTLTQADVGKSITVAASYTDDGGTAESLTSAALGPVANVNDAPTGVVSIAGSAQQGQTLEASQNLSDVDGMVNATVIFQWLRNGVAIEGAQGNAYTLTQSDVGKSIGVVASYTDDFGTRESVAAAPVGPVVNANDAPASADATVTLLEDSVYGFKSADFPFIDADPTDQMRSVQITSLPAAGVLSLNGVPVVADQAIDIAAVAAGLLRFAPAADGNGADYSSFGFRVSDGALASQGNSMTLDVVPVNDPPVLVEELLAQTAIVGGAFDWHMPAGSFKDVDSGDTLSFTAKLLDGSALPAWLNFDGGTLAFSGTPATGDMGSLQIAVTATDGAGASVAGAFALTVFQHESVGTSGNDKLTGTAGNDLLDGGAGRDVMAGGKGNDTYVVDAIGDRVVERANGGTDTVESSITYKLGSYVENLVLTGNADINGTGNALANHIVGNDGANQLVGGGGIDTFEGKGGDDTYVLNDLRETVFEAAGCGFDQILLQVNRAGSFSIADMGEVEGITITGRGKIDLIGNAFDNVLIGNAKANALDGGDGDDILAGGKGKDVLTGGAGADTFLFDTKPAKANTDTIVDFTPGEDSIQFDHRIFTKLLAGELDFDVFASGPGTTKAGSPDIRLFQNTDTGMLYYDPDGSGHAPAVEVAIIGHELLSTDFVIS